MLSGLSTIGGDLLVRRRSPSRPIASASRRTAASSSSSCGMAAPSGIEPEPWSNCHHLPRPTRRISRPTPQAAPAAERLRRWTAQILALLDEQLRSARRVHGDVDNAAAGIQRRMGRVVVRWRGQDGSMASIPWGRQGSACVRSRRRHAPRDPDHTRIQGADHRPSIVCSWHWDLPHLHERRSSWMGDPARGGAKARPRSSTVQRGLARGGVPQRCLLFASPA